MALGNYAYDWQVGSEHAKTLTFGEAMATARESDGVVTWDAASGNPTYTYTEEDGKDHVVWFLDAATAFNTRRDAVRRGVTGRALWYLGSEDPSIWTLLGRGRRATDPSALRSVRYGFEVDFEGEGEILDVASMPQTGVRTLSVDSSGAISGEKYLSYPTACIVRRSGWESGKKRVALTFDDGPDPLWTPQVLDALKGLGAPATFFVVGAQVEQHPDLVRRAWSEGHEIGNHSWSHPNLAEIAAVRVEWELDATQRVIEATLGRSTTLFRPPYGLDVEPSTTEEMRPLVAAKERGYLTVAEGADPRDWEAGKSADAIAAEAVRAVEAGEGHVVLLHDAGGDRSATLAALPVLVKRLRADGWTFVPVSALIGEKSRDELFPPVAGRQKLLVWLDGSLFGAHALAGRALTGLFLFSIAAGILRTVLTTLIAVRPSAPPPPGPLPARASVIVAAYNEEKVIVRTLDALLASTWPDLEVIVVDDGSRDDTSGVVERAFGGERRVRLIRKENGGKASALNRGIEAASGEILIGLDADTLFAPETIGRMMAHFSDPKVGAVAGNVHVGNADRWLPRFQAIEYVAAQNFDRRACDALDAITVVPGAVGAWRADAVRAAGGYATDTLAEDADLTWRVRRAGWRIRAEEEAHAFTEAPERVGELLKQRFRWSFGTLQTLYKHRDMLLRPRYGWLGLVVAPGLWVFSYLLPLASPLADLGLLAGVLTGRFGTIAVYAALFFALELFAAVVAYRLDPIERRNVRRIGWLPLQRLFWHYLLLVVVLRAAGAALSGVRAGWGKLTRSGNARIAP